MTMETYQAALDGDYDDSPCQDGHDGPVVPTGRHEIIDGGIAFYVRCEGCGQEGDCSIDVDEIGWHDD